jgi:hypothetical protein
MGDFPLAIQRVSNFTAEKPTAITTRTDGQFQQDKDHIDGKPCAG